MKYPFITIIVLALVIVSCIDEIKLNHDVLEPKLTVNTFITPGEVIVVNLYQNIPLNNELSTKSVKNAKVVLYENGIEKEVLEPLIYQSYGNYNEETQTYEADSIFKYRSNETQAVAGNTYKITVECKGYETVSAETTLPHVVQISGFDSITTQKNRYGQNYSEYNYKLRFTDPANETNYYRLIVEQNYQRKSFIVLGTDTIRYINNNNLFPDYVNLYSTDPLLSNENKDANTYVFGELENRYNIFSDEMINGKPYEIDFIADLLSNSSEELDTASGEYIYVKLTLQSLNHDMYYYLKSIDAQEYSDYMMFTEPVPIYSNIENGFGVFCGYTSSSVEITYGEYPKEGIKYYDWEDIERIFNEYREQ